MDNGESSGRYVIRQPVVTKMAQPELGVLHEVAITVVDCHTGKVAREFKSRHRSPIKASLQAVDQAMFWLREEAP